MDKDPIRDKLQTVLQDVGLFGKGKKFAMVATLANISPATLENLFFGDTKRPQNATVEGILTACGYERVVQRVRKINIEKELVEAREWNRREAQRVARHNAKEPTRKKRRPKKGRPQLRIVA
jgi:hypothetical protein